MLVVFVALCSVGCGGGGGGSSGGDSGSVTIISGTWQAEAGKCYLNGQESSLQGTTPQRFTLSISKNGNSASYSVVQSETVSLDFGNQNIPFNAGGNDYSFIEGSYISDTYENPPYHRIGDTAKTFTILDDAKIKYKAERIIMVNNSLAWDTEIELILARVNDDNVLLAD
jgi:hypothetical protein